MFFCLFLYIIKALLLHNYYFSMNCAQIFNWINPCAVLVCCPIHPIFKFELSIRTNLCSITNPYKYGKVTSRFHQSGHSPTNPSYRRVRDGSPLCIYLHDKSACADQYQISGGRICDFQMHPKSNFT